MSALAACRYSDVVASGAGDGQVRLWKAEAPRTFRPLAAIPMAGLDEGILPLCLPVPVCMENNYRCAHGVTNDSAPSSIRRPAMSTAWRSPATARCCWRRCAAGRGRASRLANSDARHSKPFRRTGARSKPFPTKLAAGGAGAPPRALVAGRRRAELRAGVAMAPLVGCVGGWAAVLYMARR